MSGPKSNLRSRIKAVIDQHRNPCLELSLHMIAQEVGVSRERVRQLMPHWGAQAQVARSKARVQRVLDFVEAHPHALLGVAEGGMSLKEIGEALGVSIETVSNWWREAGLPPKSLMGQKGLKTIIEWRICVICGDPYPWTRMKAHNQKNGRKKFDVCGVRCGKAASKRRSA